MSVDIIENIIVNKIDITQLPEPILMPFENHEYQIYMDPNGQIWVKLIDICNHLEINKPSEVAKRLDPEDLCEVVFRGHMNSTLKTYLVNESGLYATILRSNKPIARKFKRWVTKEVLPTIRKTGSYSIRTQPQQLSLVEVLEMCLASEKERLRLEEENKSLKPKVELYDIICTSDNSMTLEEAIKTLSIPNFGTKKFLDYLRKRRFLTQKNLPYQRYINCEYFTIKEKITNSTITHQTLITQKGLHYIIQCLQEDNILIKRNI